MLGILAWLVTDQGIKAVGLVAGAVYSAIAARRAVKAGGEKKISAIEVLAGDIFGAVEALERTGKLKEAIALMGGDAAARKVAKWSRGVTMFAAEFRARQGRPPTAADLELYKVVTERLAAAGPGAGAP